LGHNVGRAYPVPSIVALFVFPNKYRIIIP